METELRTLRKKAKRTATQMADFFHTSHQLWRQWERGEKKTPMDVFVSVNLYICNRKNYAKIERQEKEISDLKEKLQKSEVLQKETFEFWSKERNREEASETRQVREKLKEAREEINLLQTKLCGSKGQNDDQR